MNANLQKQRGLGLVTAIFLIVTLLSLAAAAVSIVSQQGQSSALDIQGSRAYQAAKAGAEWAVFRAKQDVPVCDASTNIVLPGEMSGFTATVTCTAMPVTTGTGTVKRYRVISTACSPAPVGGCPDTTTTDPDYVQRVVDLRFGD